MATGHQVHFFDDGDAMLYGDADIFGGGVTCIAGELELQVQSYEGVMDLPGGHAAGKSFSMTKDSGGSSLSALVVGDFADADFMDNVSLDDLAAADHYGHTICWRQSTADSGAVAAAGPSGRDSVAGTNWDGTGAAGARATPTVNTQLPGQQVGGDAQVQQQNEQQCMQQHEQQQQQNGQESSDCDMSHTIGDGESSGVGPGKGVALGSSHSEASEDNSAGVGACLDEEHVSMPSYGLSLSRLTAAEESRAAAAQPLSQRDLQNDKASVAATKQLQQQQQQVLMARAFSVDNLALTSRASTALPEAPASQTDCQRRAQVMRSFSYVSADTLPMEFSLGCTDSGLPMSFGTRGRCASLNESQLRRHWLQEGELLAPRLPPSVSELELLELPEDSVPVRPSKCSLLDMQESAGVLGCRQLGSSGMARQFIGSSSSAGCAGGQGATGTTVTVKRKIITSPSPLLPHPRSSKTRQAAAAAANVAAADPAIGKLQSPKRARVCPGAWQQQPQQDGAGSGDALALADWTTARGAGGVGAGGGLKTVRSMPANMNSFFDSVEVTVQPLSVPAAADTIVSPNNSSVSASTPHQPFARGPFYDAAAGGAAAPVRPATVPLPPVPPAAKAGKGRGAAAAQAPALPAGMPGVPCAFPMPGIVVGPDGKRLGPVPSVPKPRKRASPNGNPPKAPAPNPNGHCCTQCGTQTTPVWRAGPHGPKTLCNACGVRYMKVAKGNVAPTPRRQQH